MIGVDYYLIKRALTGPEDECGDTGICVREEDCCFIAHIDALGHGKEAYKVAMIAEEYLRENYRQRLTAVMSGLHDRLKGTRGAVASVCLIDLEAGRIEHVGVGNISVRIFGGNNHTFVSRDGVIGYSQVTPRTQIEDFKQGDVLVLTSDGVREHYRLEEYPDLLYGSSREIAEKIVDYLGKNDDDVSCSVMRY